MELIVEKLGQTVTFLIVLSIVVIIHELGHFLTAKLFKIRVETFSMGFGKRLFGLTRGGTDYRLSALPLGGYVKLAGEQVEDATGKPDEFQSHPRWQRVFVFLMGPVMNVILAFVLFSAAYMIGVRVPAYRDEPAVLGPVEQTSPAAKAGFRTGDRIVRVDSEEIRTWDDLEILISTSPGKQIQVTAVRDGIELTAAVTTESRGRYSIGHAGFSPKVPLMIGEVISGDPAARAGMAKEDIIVSVQGKTYASIEELSAFLRANPGKPLHFVLERGGRAVEMDITPRSEKGEGRIGISWGYPTTFKAYSFFRAVQEGARQCREMSTLVFRVLRKYVQGDMPLSNLSGPLDIAKHSLSFALAGFSTFLLFLATISLQLGIINLLPIPVLDGGHIFILAVESTARRDLSLKVKERVLQVGFVLLLLLMSFVIINDIVKFLPESLYKYVPWAN